MDRSAPFLSASEAAARLGVSAKALRLYEQRGLVAPVRTRAGWRSYGPGEMSRAAEIVALRGLGLSLAQVKRVLDGKPQGLEPVLAAHQAALQRQGRDLASTIDKIRVLRAGLDRGQAPSAGELARLLRPEPGLHVAFDLPWPWGGERFELRDIKPLTYVTGPLGSGKTRLIGRLAETLPQATLLGLERMADGGAAARAKLASDTALAARVERTLAWLVEDGAALSDALVALLAGLEAAEGSILVVDMVEDGLDRATQEAVIAHLRQRQKGRPPLFLMTRSCAILDLAAIGPDEAIIYCPANHGPPLCVAPYPGATGYEPVATCLASPEVRARTQGVMAIRPQVA